MTKQITFLFSGQGAQYPHMLQKLANQEQVYQETLEKCYDLFATHDIALNEVMQNETIHQTQYTQPALFAVEYALATLWQSWGYTPSLLIGHSIGEIVAATFSGVMSISTACHLVAKRAKLMQSLPLGGGMLAVLTSKKDITPILDDSIDIAAINSQKQLVVSGSLDAIANFTIKLKKHNIRSRPLTVSHAFHSTLMEPILADFIATQKNFNYHSPKIPIISNITGKIVVEFTPEYWAEHIRSTVLFMPSLLYSHQLGCRSYVECGPASILTNLAKKILNQDELLVLPSCQKQDPDDLSIYESKKILEQFMMHHDH